MLVDHQVVHHEPVEPCEVLSEGCSEHSGALVELLLDEQQQHVLLSRIQDFFDEVFFDVSLGVLSARSVEGIGPGLRPIGKVELLFHEFDGLGHQVATGL